MCGIAGIFGYGAAAGRVGPDELRRMRESMAARGPDADGEWLAADGRVGFAHRRLSIIDLSERGAQPMHSADGRFVIMFNGEIYNYKELRRGLEAKGDRFGTESDTEVLLHLYAEAARDGRPTARHVRLRAVGSASGRPAAGARRFGIKPLYYADERLDVPFCLAGAGAARGRGAVSASPTRPARSASTVRQRARAVHDLSRHPRVPAGCHG